MSVIAETLDILIVEDAFADIEMTRKKLLRCAPGATLDIARTTMQAMGKLRDKRYDCILLDLNLPDSVGPSSISDIRRTEQHTPIVVLTGFASPITVEEALKAGAQKVLSKSDLSNTLLGETLADVCPQQTAAG
jgi:CheY-like chemotaxis protein